MNGSLITYHFEHFNLICYVMLCYVMLCYVMLCYVMLCYFILFYFIVYCYLYRNLMAEFCQENLVKIKV